MRVIGSPDPYGKHTDGMGGGTSSTSKTVILAKSERPDHDVDYLFGQVAIDKPLVDWSGNCGNLSAAVGPFAIANGLVKAGRIPDNGVASVRIWQKNIEKTIIAHVPIIHSMVQETGSFGLDGVAFPAAKVSLEFLNPISPNEAMFPTGHLVDDLVVPGIGTLKTTMIHAGIPTLFVNAHEVGCQGTERPEAINRDKKTLAKFEAIRAYGALRMGLIKSLEEARLRQHTPKIAFVSKPRDYTASHGKAIHAADIDLNVRALSMGKLHHAMMGTAAVAIATAAVIPGTVVNLAAGGIARNSVIFGHPSGRLQAGASVTQHHGTWSADKVVMDRSARVLMEGWVRIPNDAF
jgi:probable AcnD-accessory protein PrpF